MIVALIFSLCVFQQAVSAEAQFDIAKAQKSLCVGLNGLAKVTQKQVAASYLLASVSRSLLLAWWNVQSQGF